MKTFRWLKNRWFLNTHIAFRSWQVFRSLWKLLEKDTTVKIVQKNTWWGSTDSRSITTKMLKKSSIFLSKMKETHLPKKEQFHEAGQLLYFDEDMKQMKRPFGNLGTATNLPFKWKREQNRIPKNMKQKIYGYNFCGKSMLVYSLWEYSICLSSADIWQSKAFYWTSKLSQHRHSIYQDSFLLKITMIGKGTHKMYLFHRHNTPHLFRTVLPQISPDQKAPSFY